tara:strand:- start:82 stop:399 length:318 start_codon:yes stop_codon:yes gene_type:complete
MTAKNERTVVDETTGRWFRYTHKGKRFRQYVNDDSKKLASYLNRVDVLIGRLGREIGFTEKARREIRRRLRLIMNDPELSLSAKVYPPPAGLVGSKWEPIDLTES